MCMCVHATCRHESMHVRVRGQHWVSSSITFHLTFQDRDAHWLTGLAGQWAIRICLSSFNSSTRVLHVCCHIWLWRGCYRFKPRSSGLYSRCFTDETISGPINIYSFLGKDMDRTHRVKVVHILQLCSVSQLVFWGCWACIGSTHIYLLGNLGTSLRFVICKNVRPQWVFEKCPLGIMIDFQVP